MRIIVLQLARFGDIYQTWPALKALRRAQPEAEVHVLVRERFRSAIEGLDGVHVHCLPTRSILEPIFSDQREELALHALEEFLAPLKALNFERVINLTFSPLSSYLTDILSGNAQAVSGYSRFADGTLAIPDDMSAYFYAQVGIDRDNRFHLSDIFASVAGVDLEEQDFSARAESSRSGIVVHLGASTQNKIYAPELWAQVLRGLGECKIKLIGSEDERGMSLAVEKLSGRTLENLVGQTKLSDLKEIIGQAELLIGADSAPIHIASLTQTPTLNLSSSTVNFFETGPRAAKSRVLFSAEINAIDPRTIASEALAMLAGEPPKNPCAYRETALGEFNLHEIHFEDFSWRLIQALYTNADYPAPEKETDLLAFKRLNELSDLARLQLSRWGDADKRSEAARILAQIDELLGEVAKLAPRVEPLVQWFQTQRLRIPPGTDTETLERTVKVFNELELITSIYREPSGETELLKKALESARKTLPEMRECNLNPANYEFQNLIGALHELTRSSTKVGDKFWSTFLTEFTEALEARDYVHLSDLTEAGLMPELSRRLNEGVFSADVIS